MFQLRVVGFCSHSAVSCALGKCAETELPRMFPNRSDRSVILLLSTEPCLVLMRRAPSLTGRSAPPGMNGEADRKRFMPKRIVTLPIRMIKKTLGKQMEDYRLVPQCRADSHPSGMRHTGDGGRLPLSCSGLQRAFLRVSNREFRKLT